MNFETLQDEFYARGFDYLDQTAAGQARAKRWLNQAHQELCEIERWPFLKTTASGAAPLTIADLGAVESVRDTAQSSASLEWKDLRGLAGSYGDLTTTGSPRWFYIDENVIRTYPVGGTLTVTYWQVPADMSADADLPVVPTRFHDLIVDMAVLRAYKDADNFVAAGALGQMVDQALDRMRLSLLGQQHTGHDTIAIHAGSGDW